MLDGKVIACLLQIVALWRAAVADYGPSSLSQEERDLFLDFHNELRAQVDPEAANMKYMKWDDSLADMAQAWSDTCHWGHGQPTPNISPFPKHIGQNLYLVYPGQPDLRPNGSEVTTGWFDEIAHYTFETNACESDVVCGHYTQLAWASSYALGCGMTLCETATGISANITNMWIISCNYRPTGNVVGEKPYIAGKPCTKCESGIGECYNSQCRPCSDHQEECVCAQICANCGVLNTTSCACKCPNGFGESDCSIVCEDYNDYCNNGYPVEWCEDGEYHDYMHTNCPASCGLCNPEQDPDFECNAPVTGTGPTTDSQPSVSSPQTSRGTEAPLTGQPTACPPLHCQHGGVLDEESCSCECTAGYQGPQCEQLEPTTGPETTREGEAPATPIACGQLDCQNDGSFDSETCRCRCAAQYQGALCQHNRQQAAHGVVITLVADINLWDVIAPTLKTIIADALTSYCNENFELCCPNRGPKNISEKLPYANESNIQVAEGYPEPQVDDEGTFTIMFLATGLEEAELCLEGGTLLDRRRREVAMGDVRHAVHARSVDSGGLYMDQSILLQVIQESTANMSQGLADLGIAVTVAEVEAGKVEPPPPDATAALPPSEATRPPTSQPPSPAPDPGLSTGAISGIVIGSAVLLSACVGAILFGVKASNTSTKVRPFKE